MPKDLKQRAQIFQSFDALKGFREILRETERCYRSSKSFIRR